MQERSGGPLPDVSGESLVRLLEPPGGQKRAHVAHLGGAKRGGEPLATPRWSAQPPHKAIGGALRGRARAPRDLGSREAAQAVQPLSHFHTAIPGVSTDVCRWKALRYASIHNPRTAAHVY